MAITPNPVTAFRKSGKTPPKPPNLADYFKTLYGENEVFGKPTTEKPTPIFCFVKNQKQLLLKNKQKLFEVGTKNGSAIRN
jgi:hypothetical protein